MALTFTEQRFGDVSEEANRLGRDHWRELYGDTPYPADPEAVAKLNDAGAFAYFVAKTPEGEIVGHVGFFLLYSPVHASHIAIDVFYYIDPAHRRHGTSRKLLKHAGEVLSGRGASVLVSALRGANLGQMIEAAGYERASTLYRYVGV